MKKVYRKIRNTILAVIVVSVPASVWLWNDRPQLIDTHIVTAAIANRDFTGVTATWLGVSTILFDDGETQLLIDGFFSRPTALDVLLGRPVNSDAATINYMIESYAINRLAAVIAAHSHYDHAMDVGAISLRTDAEIIGSESTANIARGAGVADERITVLGEGGNKQFGQFIVTLIPSIHAPVGRRGRAPIPGTIDKPLQQPQPIGEWKEGGSYSIIVEHPLGSTLVQASAGFKPAALDDITVNTVFLGVGGMKKLGAEYARNYWTNTVHATGAKRVIVVHFDDFSKPGREMKLFPRIIDDPVDSIHWLTDIAEDEDVTVELPPFGAAISLY